MINYLRVLLVLTTVFVPSLLLAIDPGVSTFSESEGGFLEEFYDVDNVYSTYSPSTNFTINGGMYSDRDGLAVRPKTTTQAVAGIKLVVDEEITVTSGSALVIDINLYSNMTRTIKVDLILSDASTKTMQNTQSAYLAKNNQVVDTHTIGNNAFNNYLNASSGFATKVPSSAYNQLVIPFTSYGLTVGQTVTVERVVIYAPSFSTAIYNKYVLMGVNVTNDFSTSELFNMDAIWTVGDAYELHETASTNLDIRVIHAGELLMLPSTNTSGNGVIQELVFKFPDELINESGHVETENIKGLTIEFDNQTSTEFNGFFKLYNTAGNELANSNYTNLKTHKISKTGNETDSNAKYFYPNTHASGYYSSFILYNFDATSEVTENSTESFYSAAGSLPAEISPYFSFSYDTSNTFSLEGVYLGKIRILTSDITVYTNSTSHKNLTSISSTKGYIGNEIVYHVAETSYTLLSATLNDVELSENQLEDLLSSHGLKLTITGDNHLKLTYDAPEDVILPFGVDITYHAYFPDQEPLSFGINDATYGHSVQIVDVVPDGYAFGFFVVNGQVRTDLPWNHSFIAINDLSIDVVFQKDNIYTVLFKDSNGKAIDYQFIESGGHATAPLTGAYSKPNYVISDIPWKDQDGNISLENITTNKVFTLQYTKVQLENVTITVVEEATPQDFVVPYNSVITLNTEITNPVWKDESGNVISYQQQLKVSALVDTTYFVEPFVGETENLIYLAPALSLREAYTSLLAKFELQSDEVIVEFGIIVSNDSGISLENDNVYRSTVYHHSTFEFLRSISSAVVEGRYVAAYIIYLNSENQAVLLMSNTVYVPNA